MSWITEKRGSHLCEANHRKGSALKKRSGWLMSTLSSAKKVKTPLGMKPSSQARLEWSGFQSSPVGWPVHINPAVCQKQFHRFCVSFFDRPCRTMSLDQNPPPHGLCSHRFILARGSDNTAHMAFLTGSKQRRGFIHIGLCTHIKDLAAWTKYSTTATHMTIEARPVEWAPLVLWVSQLRLTVEDVE